MKINYKKTLAIGLSLAIFLPMLVSAVTIIPAECTGSDPSKCNFDSFMQLINNVVNWFIGISASVAALTFSYAGAMILLNPEKPAEIQKGWDMFRKTVWGMLFVLGSWLIMHTVIKAISTNPDSALHFLGK